MPEKEDNNQNNIRRLSLPYMAGFGFLNHSVESLMYFILFVFEENLEINLEEALKDINTLKDFINFARQMRDLAIGKRTIKIFGKKSERNTKLLDDVLDYLSQDRSYDNLIQGRVNAVIRNFLNSDIKHYIRIQLIELPDRPSRFHTTTNQSISGLAQKILDEADGDSVMDICSGSGSFLCRYASNGGQAKHFYGVEINTLLSLIARIKFAIIGLDCDVEYGDIFKLPSERKYLKVFCDAPFGVRLPIDIRREMFMKEGDISFSMTTSSEWIYAFKALEYLDDNGKLVVVMPCGSLMNLKDGVIRDSLVSKGLVEAVVELPYGATFGTTGIAMIVFSHGNKSIRFVDAKDTGLLPRESRFYPSFDYERVFDLLRKSGDEHVKDISCDEVLSNDSVLLPNRYTGKSDMLNHLPNAVSLENITEDIFRGYQITAAERSKLSTSKKDKNSVRVLTVSDINNSIISEKLDRLKFNQKFLRYYLKDGDIVLSAKGDRAKVAVVNVGKDVPIFPNGSLIVIRLEKGCDPYYICAFLESYVGEIALDHIRTGSIIKSINPSSLMKLRIPFPSDKSMKMKVVEKYKVDTSLIKAFSEKLKELENEKKSAFDWASTDRS